MDSHGGPAWLGVNSQTDMYITADLTLHKTANPLHRRATQVQHRSSKCDNSAEHLLAELGQLSLNTLTHKKEKLKF